MKQNPFSLYDFLGYFIPGAVFLMAMNKLSVGYQGVASRINEMFGQFYPFSSEQGVATKLIPFVLFAYAIGHLFSLLSSYTVERASLWLHGYPSKYLLRKADPEKLKHPGFWRSREFENYLWRNAYRIIVIASLLPIFALEVIIGKWLRLAEMYARELDEFVAKYVHSRLRAYVKEQVQECGSIKYDPARQDFFRIMYHYALENSPNHVPKMQNYVALYGFMRTMCLVCVAWAWIVLLKVVTRLSFHDLGSLHEQLGQEQVFSFCVACFSSYGFFVGFVKFYRRFSLEAFMAFVVSYRPKKGDDAPAECSVT